MGDVVMGVVRDGKKGWGGLKWGVGEMREGYKKFGEWNVGKWIVGVEIGEGMGGREIVVYVDFEVCEKELEVGYREGDGRVDRFGKKV